MSVVQSNDKRTGTLSRKVRDEEIAGGQWGHRQLPAPGLLSAAFDAVENGSQVVSAGVLVQTRSRGAFSQRSTDNSGRSDNPPRAIQIAIVNGSQTPVAARMRELELDHVYFGPAVRGIKAGVVGQPVNLRHIKVDGASYLDCCRRARVDGLLVLTAATSDIDHLHSLFEARVPFVSVGITSTDPSDEMLPLFDAPNRAGGADAARHLLDLGHRRIGCVNLSTSYGNLSDRMTGFHDAIRAAGIPIDSALQCLGPTYYADQFDAVLDRWLSHLVESGRLPTAIMACDFCMTLAVLSALRRRKLVVPNDVSLIGFDDPLLEPYAPQALTVIRQPAYAVGFSAVNRLVQAITAPGGPLAVVGHQLLANEVVVQSSTCPARQ